MAYSTRMPMPPDDPPAESVLITRRAALARAAALLGSALAAPTIAGVLAGCGDQSASRTSAPGATLRALQPEQERLVAAVAEVILPATDTPGARDVGVSQFVDRMLADHHPAEVRAQFTRGLARLDARAAAGHGAPFVRCTAAQQFALIDTLDAEVFGARTTGADASSPAAVAATDSTPAAYVADADLHACYRTLKELTLVGYYTSEAGATRELRVNPMGRWRADVPYTQLGTSWA
ncbi:MAG: gluconate 2-dehydrogenase subunit 3 family protein [Gemmatimonadaceae bacterium]|nr:gluconate 2-dehydrogenase subunit 3 family protein [Gemmatimonadaceae bacterium]